MTGTNIVVLKFGSSVLRSPVSDGSTSDIPVI